MEILKNIHLTYCTNIHKNKNLKDTLQNIKKYAIKVKNKLCPNQRFGIGLCLSFDMSTKLINKTILDDFNKWLNKNNLYIFTINGFVYNYFHKKNIKENIYEPDWSTEARFNYTKNLIDTLSKLLDTNYGSISTIPICYKKKFENRKKKYNILQKSIYNLMEIVLILHKIEYKKNKKIILCFEPEPDCFLENTHDIIFFYKNTLLPYGVNYLQTNYGYTKKNATDQILRYLQICYDTCHFAIQYEKPKETLKTLIKHNISIGKIQISSLLHINVPRNTYVEKIHMRELHNLSNSPFLHQTRTYINKKKSTYSCEDYSKLISTNEHLSNVKRSRRIHYHLPIYRETFQHCSTTKKHLSTIFTELDKKNTIHLEIETYTWLTTYKKKYITTVESIIKEYEYILTLFKKTTAIT